MATDKGFFNYCVVASSGKGFITHVDSRKFWIRGYPGNVWVCDDIPESRDWGARNSAASKTKAQAQTIVTGVVDDAKENARLFKLYLEEAGAVVEVANDGETALEKASSQFFDIVLLDLQMPGKDGFQVIRELRKKSFERPIAALTAHAMKEERDKTAEAGFDDHITKPVQPKVLVEKVRSLLSDSTIRNH